jgi:hypothetical protein
MEKIDKPYASRRSVEVYGDDKARRLEQLPNEVGAFEKSMTSLTKDIKSGQFDRMRNLLYGK